MEEFILTLEELQTIFSLGYHRGVNDGEDGIPEDFKSFLPRHLEWYAQLGLDKSGETQKRITRHLRP